MAKNPFAPTGMGSGGGGGGGGMAGIPGGGGLKPTGGSSGKPGAKKGMPNFKSRITKPGGLKKGGKIGACMAKGGAVKAGAGSGISRLQRSK